MNLTEHFTLEELTVSQTAARLGLDNTPGPEALANLRHLCEALLEPARLALGPLHVSSGYRAPDVDDAIPRAAANARPSDHRRGHAADVVPLAASKLAFARWVKLEFERWDPAGEIILEFGTLEEPAWVHVSAAPDVPVPGRVQRILAGGGYEVVTL
jgi:hypothetical protein